jgi:hypothetical protein
MHMTRTVWLVAVAASVALGGSLKAEKVSMSPEQLRQTATHVVTGQAIAVYERTQTEGGWKYTRYVASARSRAISCRRWSSNCWMRLIVMSGIPLVRGEDSLCDK